MNSLSPEIHLVFRLIFKKIHVTIIERETQVAILLWHMSCPCMAVYGNIWASHSHICPISGPESTSHTATAGCVPHLAQSRHNPPTRPPPDISHIWPSIWQHVQIRIRHRSSCHTRPGGFANSCHVWAKYVP